VTDAALDAPWQALQPLPRALWLPGAITSVGTPARRLADIDHWRKALPAGLLPDAGADFGDSAASAPLRAVVGELHLPALARDTPALAEQVLRTLLWHLDRIVDHQPALSRAAAIERVTEEFRSAWQEEGCDLAADLALLQQLGHADSLRWDQVRGHLRSRPWRLAQQAAERLAQLPALAELIRRLGRSERAVVAERTPQAAPANAAPPLPMRAVHTTLEDAPGEITGIRWSSRIEGMLGSEAVMLRHPVLKKLWRARHAEARLLGWQTEALLTDWRIDPHARPQGPAAPERPEALERGPFILCLDTSGSMRGAPEQIAKAVAIAAVRAAHEGARGCRLIAFGGPDELVERDLGPGPEGLQSLLDLMAQSFDGGTDVQAPIEAAIERVHDARWSGADLLIVSDGEFGCVPHTLQRLDNARARFGLRVQGVLVGDRETMGLLEVCDQIHWVRDWRRLDGNEHGAARGGFSPVHSKSLTALYFPNALSPRAARHHADPGT
jgi:uncharacterized protein with von Willebrand factor type A (vWA) domain